MYNSFYLTTNDVRLTQLSWYLVTLLRRFCFVGKTTPRFESKASDAVGANRAF